MLWKLGGGVLDIAALRKVSLRIPAEASNPKLRLPTQTLDSELNETN
jgi:hypothetical protein